MRVQLLRLLAFGALAATLFNAGVTGVPPSAAQTPPTPAPELDWAVPNGHYFTQAGAGAGGYAITDDEGMKLWTAFQQLGSTPTLGFPASRRFLLNGFTYQATQAALLQWRADQGGAVLGNTFELLQEAGKDDWLEHVKGIPRPIANDGSTSYDDAVRVRMAWLSDPALRQRYLVNPNPASRQPWTERESIQLYGLPMSRPERFGPFISQRFQRIAFQLWIESVAGMPAPGTVTAVLGGDLLKEAGIIYGTAVMPHASSALVGRPVVMEATATSTGIPPSPTRAPIATATPRPPARNTPVPTPRPGAGATQVIDGTLSEYSISLARITAKLGTVRFTVANVGTARHNLRVQGNGVDKKTPDLRGGQSGQVEVTFDDPGAYFVYCDIGDHEGLGMSLTFNVET